LDIYNDLADLNLPFLLSPFYDTIPIMKTVPAVKIAAAVSAALLIVFLAVFFSNPGKNASGGASGESPATAQTSVPSITAPRAAPQSADPDREAFVEDFWRWIFSEAAIPDRIAGTVAASMLENPSFMMELLFVLQSGYYTHVLVDKQHALPLDYSPDDLVSLTAAGSFRITRNDLQLRASAASALEEMAAVAAADGVILTAASAYRSAARQTEIFAWQVQTFGREAAERQSARPGHSQHQLGTVVDFYPIEDSFAETPQSRWLVRNASRFGWSLSFPDGYEHITGYRFEPWHYRYIGRDLAAFIDTYFEGIQQFALQFIQAWQEHSS